MALTLSAPAVASAAPAPHLTAQQAIAVAASHPSAATLLTANPGSHWEAVYDRPSGVWTVVLEPHGSHIVLATYRVDDRTRKVLSHTNSPGLGPPRLTSAQATELAKREPKLRDWLSLYPKVTSSASLGDGRVWTVRFYAAAAAGNEVAEVHVDDGRMEVTDVRTGPQVDWMQARGLPDTYGRLANRWWVLLPMSLLFLAGLTDWRRPVLDAHARPAGGALVRDLAALLQPRRDLLGDAAGLPADALPAGADVAGGLHPRSPALAGGAARTCCSWWARCSR